jgi:hypothetical protein
VKSLSILAAALATGALCAQESADSLNASVILFGETIQTSGVLLGQGVKDQAGYQTGPGIRIIGQIDESHWYWEVGGRFESSARMVTNRDISSTPPPNVLDATQTKIHYSYWSLGGAYLLPLGNAVDLGFHLEGRGETINPKGQYSTTAGGVGYIDAHTVYFRPWVRLSLDVKFSAGSFRPFIGVEGAAALVKTSQSQVMPLSALDANTLRAMAPTWSGSVYAGFQF